MNANKYSTLLRVGLIAGMTALTLSACSSDKWGFPYKAPVQQGNWLTSSQVERLEVGMTREQVRYLLGTPTLQDIFHNDRWEFPYYHKPGSGKEELRLFTVWFEDNLLVRWDGSPQPNRQPFEQTDSGADSIQPKPAHNVSPQAIGHPESATMGTEPLR